MKEITLDSKLSKPLYLAMGFFDSVHIGHRELIARTVKMAHNSGAQAAVLTFSNNAYRQFNPDAKEIYTYAERFELFESLGLDYCLPFKFDKNLKNIDRDAFLHLLTKTLKIDCFVCGYDYLFGRGGEGNAAYLHDFASKNNSMCVIVPPIMHEDIRVSSSIVKKLLTCGDIERANLYLGKPFFMRSTVIAGRGVGHTLGVPTANSEIFRDKLLPAQGVYATRCAVDGKTYCSVTNVGTRPTFDEPGITVESLLADCNENLYGRALCVSFLRYLRPIQKFDSPQALASRMRADLAVSQSII